MKIRNPYLIKLAGFGAASFMRLWMGSMRYRYRTLNADGDPAQPGPGQRYIYAVWHENLLQPIFRHAHAGFCILISRHADGQLLSEICGHLRIRLIRGSTTRGGIEAVRQMLRVGREASLGITPDGPRGPRRQVQMGLIYLAAHTGLPIVPVGVGYKRAWRFNSWDRFALPQPLSLGTCITGVPIVVPAEAERPKMESYRERVQQAMRSITEQAERWAATDEWPEGGEQGSSKTGHPGTGEGLGIPA